MTTIRYDFVAAGAEENVERAFDNIDKRAALSAKANEAAQRKVTSTVRTNVIARERIEKAPVNRTAQLARQVERDQERAAARQTQRHRALLRSQISAGEQAGRAQARQSAAMRRLRERHDATEAKAHERRIAISRRAGEKQGRETGAAMAKAISSTHGASFGGILRDMVSGSAFRGAIGRLGSVIKGVGLSALGTGAALFTGVTAAGAKDAMRTQEVANRVSINARMAGKQAVDPDVLRKEFEAAAIANPGQKASEIGEAVQAFVTKTGDLAGGRRFAGTFATVASATGGNVSDIANAAADISQKFDITGLQEMQDALAALTYQGKQGAFELADAASKFAKMGSAASKFGLHGMAGLKTMGGLSQIIQGATGDRDVTATALSAMLRQFTSQADKIKKATGGKVDVFTNMKTRTKANDIQDLIVNTIAGVGGNLTKIQDIFGDEGGQAMSPMVARYNAAANALGPKATADQRVAAGKAAVRDQLSSAINAPGDYGQVKQDAAQAQQDTSARLTAAWEKITSVVGEKLLPVITEFAERIADTPELFDALRVALEMLIGMLKDLGLLKEKTPGQLAESEKKRGEKLGKRRDELLDELGKVASPEVRAEQVAELAQVSGNQADAEKQAARADALVQAQKDIQTPEALAERMISIGEVGKTPEEEARRRSALQTQARLIFAAPGAYQDDEKMDIGGGKESENQMALRRAVAQAQDAKQSTSTAGSSSDGLGAAAKALLDAANALKANAGNQPTTVAATL